MLVTIRMALVALSFVVVASSPTLAQGVGKEVVSTPNAPEVIGPYSQAIRAGNLLFLSGQIAIDPATNELVADSGIEEQTKLVLSNLQAVLEAAGLSMDHVVQTTVFLADLNDFSKMNEVYGSFFESQPPARATVEVARLPRDVNGNAPAQEGAGRP